MPLTLLLMALLLWALWAQPLPGVLDNFTRILGGAAGPCALFAIGLFLSDKSIKSGLAEAGLATLTKLLLQQIGRAHV